jgi:hypothetical protein
MAGLPGIDSLSSYGGQLSDFAPVEDPTTDESATYRNLYAANVAGMTQTACRAWATCVGIAAPNPPVDPSSNVHAAVWGNDVSVKPTVTHLSTGIYVFTWPTTVTDELAVEHTVNLRRAWVCMETTVAYITAATVFAANVVHVRVFDAAGNLADAVGTNITVFVV